MRNKKRVFILFLILVLFSEGVFGLVNLAQAKTQEVNPPKIIAIEIEGEIRAGTVEFLKRAINKAQKEKAELFLIQLNTPGGLLKSTQEITQLLLESKIKTAVFVHKKGGWAFSAGTFILISAHIASSHPQASIGAAQPRFFGLENIGKPDPKIIEASAVWIKSLAKARDRNLDLAEKFVRENLTLTGKEAEEQGVIDFTARDLKEFLVKAKLKNAKVIFLKPNIVEEIFSFLSIPQIVSLFLTIGFLGIILIFRSGQIEPIGIFAILTFLLGLWGIGAISISVLGIVLLVIGAALLIIEILNPEIGVFGILGTIFLLGGILFFGKEPFGSPLFNQAITYFVLGAGIAIGIFFIILGKAAAKTLYLRPKTGLEAFIGREAVVLEKLSPFGRIKIGDQEWRAKSLTRDIEENEKVKIVGFSGNTLEVEPVMESGSPQV